MCGRLHGGSLWFRYHFERCCGVFEDAVSDATWFSTLYGDGRRCQCRCGPKLSSRGNGPNRTSVPSCSCLLWSPLPTNGPTRTTHHSAPLHDILSVLVFMII
jgi:hypothetical protein